jgi:hypothetical protein
MLTVLGFSFLLGLSPLAADPVIQRGIDVFTTLSGEASYDFAFEPIPAGFFCKRSAAFTGKVKFRGVPLATDAPGKLWGADTVIERLDDAAFNAKGVAKTRIQFRALSLASVAPIKTACGNFHVYVSLAGPQRVTTMKIRRTEEGGGTFVAPLAVDARMTFIPVKPARAKAARKLELLGSFTFPAQPIPWSFAAGPETKRIGAAIVDTNGDLTPDTRLSGTSNFLPGQSPDRLQTKYYYGECPSCVRQTCHTDPSTGKFHCTTEPVPPGCFTPMQYCWDT